jgi:glutamine synthetase
MVFQRSRDHTIAATEQVCDRKCSNLVDKAFGRDYVEAHFKCCLHAGVAVIGLNAEVMPGQWEYQLAPLPGVEQADHLWIARYLQHRVGEIFNVVVTFDPKPVPGDWNGAGGHCNFSTKPMREEGGMQHMLDAIKKLEAKHEEHIACYGRGNNRRLTGKNETADLHSFSYGVEDRKASIRIPYQTDKDQKGT